LTISTQCLPLTADEEGKEPATMIISVTVPDKVARAAQNHNMSIEEFVDSLIDKGMATETGLPKVSDAIERIRALHSDVLLSGKR
jgi:hypothetical protein